MEEYSNKKLIVALIIAGLVIGGGYYIYKNYSPKENQ